MRTSLDCMPCFARQALDAARQITDSPEVHEAVLRETLRLAAEMDLSQCPPVIAQQIHRRLREQTGVTDPFREAKDRFNQMAMNMLPNLSEQMRQSDDPFYYGLRMAISGNIIDLGAHGDLTENDARDAITSTLHQPFFGDVAAFRSACKAAKSLLYLADNAGEIVLDQLLLEQLSSYPATLTVAVRGAPILNDAVLRDARETGLCDLFEVIDNGSDGPGTILSDCSEAFRERFWSADLIIAKGQGNFETLSDVEANLYFLFQAKCPVIADHVGQPVGTHICLQNPCTGARHVHA